MSESEWGTRENSVRVQKRKGENRFRVWKRKRTDLESRETVLLQSSENGEEHWLVREATVEKKKNRGAGLVREATEKKNRGAGQTKKEGEQGRGGKGGIDLRGAHGGIGTVALCGEGGGGCVDHGSPTRGRLWEADKSGRVDGEK